MLQLPTLLETWWILSSWAEKVSVPKMLQGFWSVMEYGSMAMKLPPGRASSICSMDDKHKPRARCWRMPSIGLERTTPWGNPESAINMVRKSQAASGWGLWKKFRPSTTYDAIPSHTCLATFLATRRYNPCLWLDDFLRTGWANEPRGWIQLLLSWQISFSVEH